MFYAVKMPAGNRWQVVDRSGSDERLVQSDLSKSAAQAMAGTYNGD